MEYRDVKDGSAEVVQKVQQTISRTENNPHGKYQF
jgi:hypothetical protein